MLSYTSFLLILSLIVAGFIITATVFIEHTLKRITVRKNKSSDKNYY
jgi:hypothetical protein